MLNTVEEILEDYRQGKIVIIVDDENRENEGDLIVSASHATPQAINFFITHGRGLVCLALEESRAEELDFHDMVETNTDSMRTAFTVSVDKKEGTTTGISAFERSATILHVLDSQARPGDFNRPGHIFPLKAKKGGVLARPGHTEAAVDLARMAGHFPAGAICEILNPDGTMARLPQLRDFAKQHGLKIGSIEDIIQYRKTRGDL